MFVELLRKPVLDTEPDAVRKLKMFYQTCIGTGKNLYALKNTEPIILIVERDTPANENVTFHLLLQHLERFGGFPPLHGDRWQSKLSLERLLATLHLEFNIEPLFELKVAADDMNNSQHIILVNSSLTIENIRWMRFFFQINHPSLFLQASAAYKSDEEITAYLNFMISVATSLGVERTKARNEMDRILQLEKALANVGESLFLFIELKSSYLSTNLMIRFSVVEEEVVKSVSIDF